MTEEQKRTWVDLVAHSQPDRHTITIGVPCPVVLAVNAHLAALKQANEALLEACRLLVEKAAWVHHFDLTHAEQIRVLNPAIQAGRDAIALEEGRARDATVYAEPFADEEEVTT